MPRQKKQKDTPRQSNWRAILLEVWHWFYGAVILASLPLILTILYEIRCGTSVELLGHKFFSDSLLATFALSTCIFSVSTGEKTWIIFRDISVLSMISCCALYLVYYELETLGQWIPAEGVPINLEEGIELLTQLCRNHLESLFVACLICYAINAVLGIWIAAWTKGNALKAQPVPVPSAAQPTNREDQVDGAN